MFAEKRLRAPLSKETLTFWPSSSTAMTSPLPNTACATRSPTRNRLNPRRGAASAGAALCAPRPKPF